MSRQFIFTEAYDTPLEVRGMIFCLRDIGKSVNFVVDYLASISFQISPKTVKNIFKSINDNKTFRNNKKNSGLKPLIGEQTSKKIIKEIKENPLTTAVDLFKNDEINHNLVGLSTIKDFLSSEGLHARKIPIKFSISERNKEKRLDFCKKLKKWKASEL